MTAGKTAPNQATAGQTAPNQGQVRHISDPALYINDHLSMQALCICEPGEKDDLLLQFFQCVEIAGRSIVFCDGAQKAWHLYDMLKNRGLEPLVVDSGDTMVNPGDMMGNTMTMTERQSQFKLFRNNTNNTNYNVCIVTNRTEIKYSKIDGATFVVMYDLPWSYNPSIIDVKRYAFIQRRLVTNGDQTQGVCLNLVDSTDELNRFAQIQCQCKSWHRPHPGIFPYIFRTRDLQTQQLTDAIGDFERKREEWMEI